MSGLVAYVLLLGVAIGVAVVLFFGLRATKFI